MSEVCSNLYCTGQCGLPSKFAGEHPFMNRTSHILWHGTEAQRVDAKVFSEELSKFRQGIENLIAKEEL